MTQNIAGLRQVLSRVKPWAGVAMVLAVVLLVFYLVQGWRYWQASADSYSLSQEIQKSEEKIALMSQGSESATAELESQQVDRQRSLEELRDSFSYRSTGSLMATIASVASAASVELTSMNPDFPRTEVLGELQYQVQTLAISVRGETADLYSFLASLHQQLPVVIASDISIGGFDGRPQAQLQLLFYLSPEPIQEPEETG